MPTTPAAVSLARHQFTRFVERFPLSPEVVGDITLAVGEALANSAEHGRHAGGEIELTGRVDGTGVEIRVSDNGPGFLLGPRPLRPPDLRAPRGFGIYLMYRLMDQVEFNHNGTAVRMFKAFARNRRR